MLSMAGPLSSTVAGHVQYVLDVALVAGSITKARVDTAYVQLSERGPDGGFVIRNVTYTLFAFEFAGLLLLVIADVLLTSGDSLGSVGLPRSPQILWLLALPAAASVLLMCVTGRGRPSQALRGLLLVVGYAGLGLLACGLRRPLITSVVWLTLALIVDVFVLCFMA